MANEPSESPSFSLARRWSTGLAVTLAVVSFTALAVMINYLGARYYARLDWSSKRQAALSPRTLGLLAGLTNQIQVTVYFDSEKPLSGLVTALLNEYKYRCPRLRVEVVDYIRNTGAAKLAQARYQLTQVTDKDLVVFDCGGRIKIVYATDLADVDVEAVPGSTEREYRRRLLTFKGEMQFTSAILSVASPSQPKAYFLQGHGEHAPDNDDAQHGFSKFAGVLRDNNVQVERLTNLVALTEVPLDCRLLILAGPTTPLLPDELAKIEQYLTQGGRVLVLLSYFGLNRNPELTTLLSQWGVQVGNNRVVDREHTVNGQDLLTVAFGNHEIVRPLAGTQLHLQLPRTISRSKAGGSKTDAAKVEELALTGPNAIVATLIRNGVVYPDPARDFRGTVSLVVAVERGGIKGISTERGTTRLVAAGDSFFLGNGLIDSAGNRDFAHQAVNWLLDRTQLLPGLGPRPIREFRLAMTAAQLRRVRWLLLVLLPGAVLVVGGLVWLRRRR